MIPDNLEPIETLEQGVALFERVGTPARDLAERTRHEYTNDLADLAAHLRQRGIAGLKQIDLQHLEGYQAELFVAKPTAWTGNTLNMRVSLVISLHDSRIMDMKVNW